MTTSKLTLMSVGFTLGTTTKSRSTNREVDQLAEKLIERRQRAGRISIFDVYGNGPSLMAWRESA